MEKSKVYFTKEITPESVVKMYETLGVKLPGKVAVKLHSGEQGNQNYIRPEFVKAIEERNEEYIEKAYEDLFDKYEIKIQAKKYAEIYRGVL